LALLIVATALETLACSLAFDDVLVWRMYDPYALADNAYASASGVSRWWSLAPTLAAGALALHIGPRRTATFGALVAALGIALAAIGMPYQGATVLVCVGIGLFRPCPLAAAAEAVLGEKSLERRRFVVIAAVALAFTGCVNVASVVASPAVSRVTQSFDPTFVIWTTLALFVLAGALCAVADVLGRRRASSSGREALLPGTAYRSAAGPVASSFAEAPPAKAIKGIVWLIAPAMLLVNVGYIMEVPAGATRSALAAVAHPAVRALASFSFAALAVVVARRGSTWPVLAAWAIALAVYGLGLVPAIWSIDACQVVNRAPFFASALPCSVATPLLEAISLGYVALSTRSRHATVAVAVWTVVCRVLPSSVLAPLLDLGRPTLLVLVAAACTFAGIRLLLSSGDLHRSLFERGANEPG
jgi:hypothetical protein